MRSIIHHGFQIHNFGWIRPREVSVLLPYRMLVTLRDDKDKDVSLSIYNQEVLSYLCEYNDAYYPDRYSFQTKVKAVFDVEDDPVIFCIKQQSFLRSLCPWWCYCGLFSANAVVTLQKWKILEELYSNAKRIDRCNVLVEFRWWGVEARLH
jgi:hypothetical protein